jgi:putative resolvase
MPVPVVQTPSGRWLVTVPGPGEGRVVAYYRVSSAGQRDDLERQAGRVAAGATGRGLAVSQVVTEVGSGMNGCRRKLARLLSDLSATVIIVEHRDSLPRFGFEHLAASLAAAGRRIVVLDETETTDDLVRDDRGAHQSVRRPVRAPAGVAPGGQGGRGGGRPRRR